MYKLKVILGFIFFISLWASVILLFVCVCNYLIAYISTGNSFSEVYGNNLYVRYWVNLLCFFLSTFIISFLGFIVIKPAKMESEGFRVYENRGGFSNGRGPVDEYVTVRIKKDELSKLRD